MATGAPDHVRTFQIRGRDGNIALVTAAGNLVTSVGGITITAGEALAALDIVRPNASGNMVKAQADSPANALGACGFSDGAIAIDVSGTMSSAGAVISNASWALTPATPVYLSRATAGAMTQDVSAYGAGDVICAMGIALTATTILVIPMMIYYEL